MKGGSGQGGGCQAQAATCLLIGKEKASIVGALIDADARHQFLQLLTDSCRDHIDPPHTLPPLGRRGTAHTTCGPTSSAPPAVH